MIKKSRYLVTGGGTAGHVYPGLAIAEAIRKRAPESQFLFVGAKSGAEERVVPPKGYDLRTLGVKGLPAGKTTIRKQKEALECSGFEVTESPAPALPASVRR